MEKDIKKEEEIKTIDDDSTMSEADRELYSKYIYDTFILKITTKLPAPDMSISKQS